MDLLAQNKHIFFATKARRHKVTNNGFMGTLGVTIIDKQKYLENIEKGIFGGLPRKMEIAYIEENGTIAMIKIRLESAENYFVSYNSILIKGVVL